MSPIYTKIKQDIINNKVFITKPAILSKKEALQFTNNKPASDEIWGGEIASKLTGLLIKMSDGHALVIIHYKGQTLQKDGDFEKDEKVFEQILSTFKFTE